MSIVLLLHVLFWIFFVASIQVDFSDSTTLSACGFNWQGKHLHTNRPTRGMSACADMANISHGLIDFRAEYLVGKSPNSPRNVSGRRCLQQMWTRWKVAKDVVGFLPSLPVLFESGSILLDCYVLDQRVEQFDQAPSAFLWLQQQWLVAQFKNGADPILWRFFFTFERKVCYMHGIWVCLHGLLAFLFRLFAHLVCRVYIHMMFQCLASRPFVQCWWVHVQSVVSTFDC